jgi:amino acid transporter
MWQAVLSLGVMGMLFLIAVTATGGDMIALAQSPTPIADVIDNVLGSVVGKILLVMVVISIFSCGLTISLSGARLVWAMSRDKRFPGWKWLSVVNPKTGTPLNAMMFMLVIGQIILAVFGFYSADALFALFSAATLLPALIYAGTVLLYIVKRKSLPPTKGFDLGKWETPVLVVSAVWLLYELAIFRGESFRDPWLYVLVLLAIGGVYFGFLLFRHGRAGLTMPDLHDIDKELDADAEAVEGQLS